MANWAHFECTVCGYTYKPEEGDPERGVKPGTPFEDLPDWWECPDCGIQGHNIRWPFEEV